MLATLARMACRRTGDGIDGPYTLANLLTKGLGKPVHLGEYAYCSSKTSSGAMMASIAVGSGREGASRASVFGPYSLKHGSLIFRFRQKSHGKYSEVYTHC